MRKLDVAMTFGAKPTSMCVPRLSTAMARAEVRSPGGRGTTPLKAGPPFERAANVSVIVAIHAAGIFAQTFN